MNEQQAIRHREYMLTYTHKRAQSGACVVCGQSSDGRTYCRRCAGQRAEWQRRYRTNPLVKARRCAREAVRKAVLRGQLVKAESCDRCGEATSPIQAHHTHGYEPAFRLVVEWLCSRCHGRAHRKHVGAE